MNILVLILGLINVAIVATLLLLLGLGIVWLIKVFGFADPGPQARRAWMLLILLVAIYMLIALVAGMPSLHVVPRTL